MSERDHSKDDIKTFDTGAQCSNVPERFDLICPAGLRRLAKRYALGAKKYADYNWCKGIPVAERLNHLINHLISYLESGNESDDNMAAIAWNAFAIMHYEDNCQHHKAPFISVQKTQAEAGVEIGKGWDFAKPGTDKTIHTPVMPDLVCALCHRVLDRHELIHRMYNNMYVCDPCKKKSLDNTYLSGEKDHVNAIVSTTPSPIASTTDERGSKQS